MRILPDVQGMPVRLTDERLAHILEHPEMADRGPTIAETLRQPDHIMGSLADPQARLYYRFYTGTLVGDKYVCVVVKLVGEDAFVLTAYLTDSVKRGRRIWPETG
jgi:hypothetical protein